jgi:hypothetical protein
MPLPLSVATLVCALAWTIFAIYVADGTIVLPNSIGVALAIIQVALWGLYAGTPQSRADAEAAKLANSVSNASGEASAHQDAEGVTPLLSSASTEGRSSL